MTRQHHLPVTLWQQPGSPWLIEGVATNSLAVGTGYRESTATGKWAGRIQPSTDKFLLNAFFCGRAITESHGFCQGVCFKELLPIPQGHHHA